VKAAKSYSELDSTAQKIAARAITPRRRAEKNRRITPESVELLSVHEVGSQTTLIIRDSLKLVYVRGVAVKQPPDQSI
jgi:hypothetical protein